MVHLTEEQVGLARRGLLKKGAELADKLSRLLAGENVKIDELLAPKPGETPIERVRRYLAAVDAKIKQIDARTYGKCDACGQPIEWIYLSEVPWMDACRACAAKVPA
jgi:hypothetical protein